MAKLFSTSFEDDNKPADDTNDDGDGGLLIDRLIQSDAGKDQANSALAPASVSEQKAQLKDNVEKALSETEAENAAKADAEGGGETTPTDEPATDEPVTDVDPEEAPTDADPAADAPAKLSTPENADDEGTVAADKPTEEDDDEDKKPKTGEAEESTESYFKPIVLKYVNLGKVSKSIKDMYAGYVSQLGNLKSRSVSLEDLPVTYTKESVVDALNKLCVVIDDSIKAVVDVIASNKTGLTHLTEKFTVLQKQFQDGEKDEKVVINDKDLLLSLTIGSVVDLNKSGNEIIPAIISFVSIANAAKKVKYEELSKLFLDDSFKALDKPTDLQYTHVLPGFITVRVSLSPYNGFSSNDLDKIGVFALTNTSPNAVEAIEALQTPNQEESVSIIGTALKIIEEAAKLLDTLTGVTVLLNDLLKEVKSNIDEINSNKVNKLDIPKIDNFFKDLIKDRAMITYGKIIDEVAIS